MLEIRSSLVASAVTAAVGLSVAVAVPAVAATGSASSAKPSNAKRSAPKKKAAKKTATKKAAGPKTVTACVSKKSGATKVLLGAKAKRKCAKGWTKMTWNVTGPAGKNGTNGANGANGANGVNGANGSVSVRDSTGKRIGGFGGYLAFGMSMSFIQVISDDGGVYLYLDSTGQLLPLATLGGGSSGSPLFRDAGCAGQAYYPAGPVSPVSGLLAVLGGSYRIAYRPVIGMSLFDLGPTRAWKLSSATSVVPTGATFYELDITGGCGVVVDDPAVPGDDVPAAGDHLMHLAPSVAPPDGVGPLTVG